MQLSLACNIYRPQRSCGQGNIFAPVCHSGPGGGVVQYPLRADTPQSRHSPQSRHPPEQTPPRSRHPPEQTPPRADTPQGRHSPEQTHPPGADPPPPRADTPQEQTPPGSRQPRADTPLGADTPPGSRHPSRKQTLAYGQWAAGTHPTGMHSCFLIKLLLFSKVLTNYSFHATSDLRNIFITKVIYKILCITLWLNKTDWSYFSSRRHESIKRINKEENPMLVWAWS